MSKQRYNILRLALGGFLGVTLAQILTDASSMSNGQWFVFALGLFAAAVNYWPETKGTRHEDRG